MNSISPYAHHRLVVAMSAVFDTPVTGYIVGARFEACCCIGSIYHHNASRADGWLRDGHRIRTSDVIQVDQWEGLWTFRTQSGSFYVVATFERRTGRASLGVFLKILTRGFHITARRLQ
jgi:hypothetical protein